MARQRVHNRRAGHTGSTGASWISYSDMMAALLLVFVLILCVSLYQYFTMLSEKTEEILRQQSVMEEQRRQLDNQAIQLAAQSVVIGEQSVLVLAQQTQLDEQQAALNLQQTQLDEQAATLTAQEATLQSQSATLTAQQQEIEQQKTTLALQQQQLDEQAATLAAQKAALDEQAATVAAQQAKLDEQETTMATQQAKLDEQETTLSSQQATLTQQETTLAQKQAEIDAANEQLAIREQELLTLQQRVSDQQTALDEQTGKIDNLVGLRSKIITDLSTELSRASLSATVDPATGDIMLNSAIFFGVGQYNIKADGLALLDQFVPVYLSVLTKPEYAPYLGEIIIEGHTDSQGEYISNLELSQNRALAVAKYCLEMPSLSAADRQMLQSILTATGRSESDLIYNPDGTENREASRRVQFKFRLKDAEMIAEMNRLLQQGGNGGTAE
ncbi:MAG: OmpA family protein [Clostridia bacterium]|nr:OmpA family protein [Clostridia bacterium]